MKQLLFFIPVILLITSCGQKVIFEKKEKINGLWLYNNTVKFEYTITDTTKAYDLILKIEHTSTFSFENFYVNTTTIFPDTSKLTSALSLQLADDSGSWLGKCGSDRCSTEIYLSSSAYFKKSGIYVLIFEQHSRKDSLEGISALTVRVSESQI